MAKQRTSKSTGGSHAHPSSSSSSIRNPSFGIRNASSALRTPHSAPRASNGPLIKLRPYQAPAFWEDELGVILMLWRRQSGKSRTLAAKSLRRMMQIKGLLVTYCSASLNLGREFVVKEAEVWFNALEAFKVAASKNNQKLETNADGLVFDDFCDIFEHQKLETKLWHSRTVHSRSHIIAPNVATARSWTGDVVLDEIGFIRDFRDLFEAIEPIMSSDAKFRLLMATTPPNDDAHYSYELSVPPVGVDFTPDKASPSGHWYESQSGIMVHRADAWDTAAAGVQMFDNKTRLPITPEEHRSKSFDRDAWDRNYALIFKTGGASAVSLVSIHNAMLRGRDSCLAAEDDFPPNWRDILGQGAVTIGADPATTENEKSNPFSITILQEVFLVYFARLIIRFKTSDPAKAKAFLHEACDLGNGRKPKRLVIDATSERFWAAEVKKEFQTICPVELIVNSEKITYQGQDMTYKAYLGNLLVNTIDDGDIVLPEVRWVKDDWRLVIRDRGSFTNLIDSAGNHGDSFDSTKNALHGQISKFGEVAAVAAQVGTYGVSDSRFNRKLTMRPNHDDDFIKQAGAKWT